MQQNPGMLNGLLQNIGRSNPKFLQIISQNKEAFICILLTHIFVYFQKSKLEGQVKRRSKSFELFQLNRLIVITRISLDFKNGYNGKA